jgi:probable rRNA maturation factor
LQQVFATGFKDSKSFPTTIFHFQHFMLDPDPDRTSPSPAAPHVQVTLHWSRAAGREYSRLEVAPARRAASALSKRAVRRAVQSTLHEAPLLSPVSLSPETVFAVELSFVDDAEIQQLNASFRSKNKPTDVLSFCQLEGEAMPFAGEEILLGDILVSIETAARQARDLNHSLERELAFLVTHGTLHLCGYDHDTAARRRAMWKKQDHIVESLGLS